MSSIPAMVAAQKLLAISGTMTPMILLFFSFSERAMGLGLYRSSAASSRTICLVAAFISELSRRARDTVDTESFNRCAISLMVTLCCSLIQTHFYFPREDKALKLVLFPQTLPGIY